MQCAGIVYLFSVLLLLLFLKDCFAEDAFNTKTCISCKDPNPKLICYFTSWATKRDGKSRFSVSDIPDDHCTHIIYSFAVLNETTLKIEMGDPQIDSELYPAVTSLKSKGMTVMLAIGGWKDSENGNKYSEMINDSKRRSSFVHDTITFLKKHDFDGLDLDWEYPKCWQGNCSLGPITDKFNFANLVSELKTAFNPYGLLLSIAVSAEAAITHEAYQMEKLAENSDWVGIMSYDCNNGNYEETCLHSSFMGHQHPNTVDSINFWMVKHSIPSHKIVMGIPLYGRSFTLTNTSLENMQTTQHGSLRVPSTIGKPSHFTNEPGFIAYFEFCMGWMYQTIPGQGNYAIRDDQWVSFNDVDLVQIKSEFVIQYGLGGVMVWALDLDDFSGEFCQQTKYPLLSGIKRVLFENK